MKISDTPEQVDDLGLLRRLKEYADGKATWRDSDLGQNEKVSCGRLHAALIDLAKTVEPLLDRITSREMDTFTLHDRKHARKVAHLMWYIIAPERQEQLTPSEIGMLFSAAYIHDLGMFVSKEEREERLAPNSSLWALLEFNDQAREAIEDLRRQIAEHTTDNPDKAQRLRGNLYQAEEALLCQDTRERHAIRERYEKILSDLREKHSEDSINVVDIDQCWSFDGDSFASQLVEVCISHNEPAEILAARDARNPARPRFPRDLPVGSSQCDTQLVAAALRLADILDFDRERTPKVVYHYFLPNNADPADNISALEWGKHLAISNWQIQQDSVVFRGQCDNHVVHHGIVVFCNMISDEIEATRTVLLSADSTNWPFTLPGIVQSEIFEIGYKYVPYEFKLDDNRIHSLLMGGAIYRQPLDAVRELIQNSLDACRLRDALTKRYQPEVSLSTENRIHVEYREPTEETSSPTLSIRDSGTGMDEIVIKRFFLGVGRSFYNSREFNELRVELRKGNCDFAPVSEFGIGFLSCFLLADWVHVETAMYEALRGDTLRRELEVFGPTRLIKMCEAENSGPKRTVGTKVTLKLTRGASGDKNSPPNFDEIRQYVLDVCKTVPYTITLNYVDSAGKAEEVVVSPSDLSVSIPDDLSQSSITIAVDDEKAGLCGNIVLLDARHVRKTLKAKGDVLVSDDLTNVLSRHHWDGNNSSLIRGGFRIGRVPGLPEGWLRFTESSSGRVVSSLANLELTWKGSVKGRLSLPDLSRSQLADEIAMGQHVIRIWLTYLIENRRDVSDSMVADLTCDFSFRRGRDDVTALRFLEEFSAWDVYQFAAKGWLSNLREKGIKDEDLKAWERGDGSALLFGGDEYSDIDAVYIRLLTLVLPHVATPVVNKEGKYQLLPPQNGWRKTLKECSNFVTERKKFSNFVDFDDDGEHLLGYMGYQQAGAFNAKHAAQISALNLSVPDSDVLENLRSMFFAAKWAEPRAESAGRIELLKRVANELQDLEFWELESDGKNKVYRLGDLRFQE